MSTPGQRILCLALAGPATRVDQGFGMLPVSSVYMRYAKEHQILHPVRYELSASGLKAVALHEWPEPPQLELQGNNVYGHPHLLALLAERYGVGIDGILPTPGTTVANLLATVVLGGGGPVGLEFPVYEPLLRMVEAVGAPVFPMVRPANQGYQLEPAQVEEVFLAGARLAILSDPHNPTGACLATSALLAFNEVAQAHDAWILVDEVYLDGSRPGRASAARLGSRLITTSSLSKIYGLGSLRCGWLMADPEVIEKAQGLADTLYVGTAYPLDCLGAQALRFGDYFKARYHRLVGPNQVLMEAWLDAHPAIECVRPCGGLIYFVRLPRDCDSSSFDRILRERFEVGVGPGHFFGDPGAIRIGLGGDTAILQAGLERLAAAFAEVGGLAR